MSQPDFNNLPTRLGVYTLTERLGDNNLTTLFLATQSHMERGVVVQVLHPESDKKDVDYFLRMVRAKGAAELPRVSRVLESMMSGNIWFLTLERPQGRCLAQMERDEVRLSTGQVCSIITAAAELYQAAAARGLETAPLQADSIFVHGESDVHFLSPVIPGQYDPARQAELLPLQMQALAAALEPLLPRNVPGQTRVATLVEWIRNGYEGSYMDWASVASTAAIINEQIAPVLSRNSVENLNSRVVTQQIKQKRAQRKLRRLMLTIASCALVVFIMACVGLLLAPDEVPVLPAYRNGYVHVQTPSGGFRVSDAPVSILEYQKFLAEYDDANRMKAHERAAVNEGVPSEFENHTPADWDAQLQAASQKGTWRGRVLTTESPVCGVSYWDALAYANYKDAQLPSAQVLEKVQEQVSGDAKVDEWTSSTNSADNIYGEGIIVMPGGSRQTPYVIQERSVRNPNFSFRLTYPIFIN